MKYRILQILLGAVGSILTVLAGQLAGVSADVSTGMAVAAGPFATLSLSQYLSVG